MVQLYVFVFATMKKKLQQSIFGALMSNPSACSKMSWQRSIFFVHVQWFLNTVQFFWPQSSESSPYTKLAIFDWTWSNIIDHLQKIFNEINIFLNRIKKCSTEDVCLISAAASWVGCLLTDSVLPDTWKLREWE